MMEAIRSYESWVLTRDTRRNIPEDSILHSHRRESFKSYIVPLPYRKWVPLPILHEVQRYLVGLNEVGKEVLFSFPEVISAWNV
jgi:hypothetical protein